MSYDHDVMAMVYACGNWQIRRNIIVKKHTGSDAASSDLKLQSLIRSHVLSFVHEGSLLNAFKLFGRKLGQLHCVRGFLESSHHRMVICRQF